MMAWMTIDGRLLALVLVLGGVSCSDDGGGGAGTGTGTGTATGAGAGTGTDGGTATGDDGGTETVDDGGTGTADDGGTGTATATGTGTGTGTGECEDPCPAPNGGVEWECKLRFMYGLNYAWHHFAGDFGGIAPWNQSGVAGNEQVHAQKLQDMADHGVSVVRWWVFPDFRGDGVAFDGDENPTGLGGTAVQDVQMALELAAQADVYLMLTLFSFDNFRPSQENYGIWVPGMAPMVRNDTKRSMLLENVVRPFVQAAAESPHSNRLIAWDVINEPEWAITGPNPYGGEGFDPNPELDPVTHAEMETFIAEVIAVLRDESDALISVGGAAMKWATAWSAVDTDFHQFHIYAWVNDYWPYTGTPADYGVDDKPVVMGELPLGELDAGISYGEVVSTFYDNGYAGAMAWHYDEATPGQLDEVKAFADLHPCETKY
jgi:hypothetical protein